MAGVLIALGIFIILLIRLSLVIQYGDGGAIAFARIGLIKIRLYPIGERPDKKGEGKPEADEEAGDKGGSFQRLKQGLSVIKPSLERIRRRLTIRELTLYYTAGTQDAAMTALAYGGAHAAVSMLMAILTYNFKIKKQDIQIRADFESKENRVFVKVKLSLAVWEALYLLISLGSLIVKSGVLGKKADHEDKPRQTTP